MYSEIGHPDSPKGNKREQRQNSFNWAEDVEANYQLSRVQSAFGNNTVKRIEELEQQVEELERENNDLRDKFITALQLIKRTHRSPHHPGTGAVERGKTTNTPPNKEDCHTIPQPIPASEGKDCYSCGKPGHVVRDCPSRQRKTGRRNPLMSKPSHEASKAKVPCHYCKQKSGRASLPASGPSQEVSKRETCNFCAKTEHLWKNCKIRLRKQGGTSLQQNKDF